MRFAGQAAIVTGAARGIGEAIAERFVTEGARVLLVDMIPNVAATAARLGQPFCLCDVAGAGAGETIAEAALSALGRIDILVNNAGIGGSKPLLEADDALIHRIIDTNLSAVLRVSRDVIPHLQQPGGRIVNISSIFGLAGYRGTAAYAVAKAGVAQLTRQLAGELGPSGIRVNAVAPGVIETPMTATLREDPFYMRVIVEPIPLERLGQPADIAGPVAFLASQDAAFVTGVVLPVDGGYLAARHGRL